MIKYCPVFPSSLFPALVGFIQVYVRFMCGLVLTVLLPVEDCSMSVCTLHFSCWGFVFHWHLYTCTFLFCLFVLFLFGIFPFVIPYSIFFMLGIHPWVFVYCVFSCLGNTIVYTVLIHVREFLWVFVNCIFPSWTFPKDVCVLFFPLSGSFSMKKSGRHSPRKASYDIVALSSLIHIPDIGRMFASCVIGRVTCALL